MIADTFEVRDDIADCGDCSWQWRQPARGEFDRSGGREASKAHAKAESHRVMLRRVQWHAYTGQPFDVAVPA